MQDTQNYSQSENVIIYGKNAVGEALAAGKTIDTVYITRGGGFGGLVEKAKAAGAVVKDVSAERLAQLTQNARHGGVAAQLSAAPYSTLEEILAVSEAKNMPPFIIIADEIEDPHNLGALIRTAEAAGADGMIIPKRRSAGLTAAVFGTSAGAASWLKVCRVSNLVDTMKQLQKKGIWIYGAEADGEPFYRTDFSGGACLVIGSEGRGLGRLVRETCDKVVSIDMYGQIGSLNASVSGGILMYEIVRARRKA